MSQMVREIAVSGALARESVRFSATERASALWGGVRQRRRALSAGRCGHIDHSARNEAPMPPGIYSGPSFRNNRIYRCCRMSQKGPEFCGSYGRRHAVTAGTSYHQDDVNAREELSIAEVFETRPRRASATSCRSLTGDGAWRSRIRSLSNCGSTRLRQAEEPLGLGIRHGAANFVYGREDHEPLLPRNGVRPKVASERPEHSRVTFDLNSHLLPGMQEDAASRVDEPYG